MRMENIIYSDEQVYLESHNPNWQTLFEQEQNQLRNIFHVNRVYAIEHYGSTAVENLMAKPIIGILIGIDALPLYEDEIHLLHVHQYTQSYTPHDSILCSYWQKRSEQKFNLAILNYKSQLWHDHLVIRDYLRCHREACHEYETIKKQALQNGHTTSQSYRAYKTPFLQELFQKAKRWKQNNTL
jgi:GrpB-like predicted nucleotidyltransferase (UPF0157 family)